MASSIVAIKPQARTKQQADVKWTKAHQIAGIALQLRPAKDITLPNKIATALHGWFLDQVGKTDKALSAQLHDNQTEKAFVLSSILGSTETGIARLGTVSQRNDSLLLTAGETYHLVITGLSKPVCNWLKAWVQALPKSVRFRRGEQLPIDGWEVVHQPTTYAQLLRQGKANAESAIASQKSNKLTLSFLSPTSFRSKGNHLPLPIPRNLFHSYLRRWNSFAAKPINDADFLDWVERSVTISRYDLHTQKTAVAKGGLVTGFVGMLDLSITSQGKRNKTFVHYAYTLCQLAPYCGTGHKTTFGLGQTRLGKVNKVKRSPATDPVLPEVEQLAQQYAQTALRIEELKEIFLNHRQHTNDRTMRKAVTMATILARREAGESLKTIAQDLRLNYETAKSYSKWARKEIKTESIV